MNLSDAVLMHQHQHKLLLLFKRDHNYLSSHSTAATDESGSYSLLIQRDQSFYKQVTVNFLEVLIFLEYFLHKYADFMARK